MNLPAIAPMDAVQPPDATPSCLQPQARETAGAPARGAAVPATAQGDLDIQLHALRAEGLARLDPAGFHHLQTLARRAAVLKGPARRFLDERLAQGLRQARARLESADAEAPAWHRQAGAPLRPDFMPFGAAPSLLGLLTRELQAFMETPGSSVLAMAVRANGQGPDLTPPTGELRALRAFRGTWSRLRDEQRLAQALADVPANAGPLNTQRLVLRALQHMRECAPGYFHHFVSHLETLQCLQVESLPTGERQRAEAGVAARPRGRASQRRPQRM